MKNNLLLAYILCLILIFTPSSYIIAAGENKKDKQQGGERKVAEIIFPIKNILNKDRIGKRPKEDNKSYTKEDVINAYNQKYQKINYEYTKPNIRRIAR